MNLLLYWAPMEKEMITRFTARIFVALTLMAGSGCSPSAEPGGTRAAVANDSVHRMVPSPPTTSGEGTAAAFPDAVEHASAALTFSIIDAPNGTFGYDILSDGKLLIHQTNLPGQPGNDGCKTKADAEKLAAFVMEKIKNGEMPPTVSSTELQELRIIP